MIVRAVECEWSSGVNRASPIEVAGSDMPSAPQHIMCCCVDVTPNLPTTSTFVGRVTQINRCRKNANVPFEIVGMCEFCVDASAG